MENGLLVILLVCIGIFLICRELLCWYWKINKLIQIQEESLKNQRQIIRLLKKRNKINNSDAKKTDLSGEEPSIQQRKFKIDDLVVSVYTGKQMRVKEITPDGLYSCYIETNNGMKHEEDLEEHEIKHFGE